MIANASETDNERFQRLEAKQEELSLNLQNALKRMDIQASIIEAQQEEILKLKRNYRLVFNYIIPTLHKRYAQTLFKNYFSPKL